MAKWRLAARNEMALRRLAAAPGRNIQWRENGVANGMAAVVAIFGVSRKRGEAGWLA